MRLPRPLDQTLNPEPVMCRLHRRDCRVPLQVGVVDHGHDLLRNHHIHVCRSLRQGTKPQTLDPKLWIQDPKLRHSRCATRTGPKAQTPGPEDGMFSNFAVPRKQARRCRQLQGPPRHHIRLMVCLPHHVGDWL